MSTPEPRGGVRGAATVFTDYASVLGARFGSALLSVGSVLITTRILDPQGYGVVAYLGVVALLIFTVTSAWTSAAVSRFGREELEDHGSMLTVTWSRIELTAPLLALAALIVIALKLSGVLPSEFTWPLTVLAIASGFLMVLSEHVTYSLEVVGRMKTSAAQLLSQQLFVIVILAGILATGAGDSPFAVAAVSAAGMAIFTVVYGRLIKPVALWPPRFDPEVRKRILAFSLPLVAFTLSQYVIRSVDLVVIGAFATTASVGIYAVGYQAYGVLQQLTTASGPVLLPLFVSLRKAGREESLGLFVQRTFPQLMLVAATLAGLALPFVSIAVPIVFGERFADASDPLQILMAALVVGFAANLLAPAIVLHDNMTRPVALVNVVAMVFNVVADIALVGFANLTLTGPAIATVSATTIILVGYVGTARRCMTARTPLPVAAMLPLAAGFVPAIALPSGLAVAIGVPAAALTAVLVVLVTKPFGPEDLDLVARLDIPGPLKRVTTRVLRVVAR